MEAYISSVTAKRSTKQSSPGFCRRFRMSEETLVKDVMSSPAITISAQAELLEAALLMRQSGIRHVLVMEGERLVGVLTDRDMQRCAPSRLVPIAQEEYNAVFENTSVERVMTRDPRTIQPQAKLLDAIAAFQEMRHGCLPVVDAGRVVGILTRWDLLEAFRQTLLGLPISRPASLQR